MDCWYNLNGKTTFLINVITTKLFHRISLTQFEKLKIKIWDR